MLERLLLEIGGAFFVAVLIFGALLFGSILGPLNLGNSHMPSTMYHIPYAIYYIPNTL